MISQTEILLLYLDQSLTKLSFYHTWDIFYFQEGIADTSIKIPEGLGLSHGPSHNRDVMPGVEVTTNDGVKISKENIGLSLCQFLHIAYDTIVMAISSSGTFSYPTFFNTDFDKEYSF